MAHRQPPEARLVVQPRSSLEPSRRFYLDHIWDRATFYDSLAQALFGHAIDHTILLKYRLTMGVFLNDILAMFRERGWRLIDAEAAFASPMFAMEPHTLPAGQSLFWAAAKADEVDGSSSRHLSAKVWRLSATTKREPPAMEITTIGLDLAESVFQAHPVDSAGRPVVRKALRRA